MSGGTSSCQGHTSRFYTSFLSVHTYRSKLLYSLIRPRLTVLTKMPILWRTYAIVSYCRYAPNCSCLALQPVQLGSNVWHLVGLCHQFTYYCHHTFHFDTSIPTVFMHYHRRLFSQPRPSFPVADSISW